MSSCHVRIPGFEFDRDQIEEAIRNHRLLSMEIEFSRACNFRCPYCYVPDHELPEKELSGAEIRSAIRQAKDLGARKIIVLGGEPMVYPEIFDQLEYIRDNGLQTEMFTNGFNITRKNARRLYDLGVNVVLKLNTFDPELQDKLAGLPGASGIIRQALDNLTASGFPDDDHVLAVSTIISKPNLEEIPTLWRWLRRQNILPYVEMITPQGRATGNQDWLAVDSLALQKLFEEIARIDRDEFGQDWAPQPPLVGNACLRHGFSCLVTSTGDVMPCVGIPIPIGNIRQTRLQDILKDSEVINDLRRYRSTIKGPCSDCEKAESCYGCRGAAYHLTGDYLASDPMCWKNIGREHEIDHLPVAAADLIPHALPIRLLNTFESVGERRGTAKALLPADSPFADTNGVFDPCVHLELIAQTIAALAGFKNKGQPKEGFLVGARELNIFSPVRAGDQLEIEVLKVARFEDVGIIQGWVRRGSSVVSQGEIKVWERS